MIKKSMISVLFVEKKIQEKIVYGLQFTVYGPRYFIYPDTFLGLSTVNCKP